MYVDEGVIGHEYISELQALFPSSGLYTDDQLLTCQKRGNISPKYLHSVFFEKYFKEMLDEYVKKIDISG